MSSERFELGDFMRVKQLQPLISKAQVFRLLQQWKPP